ncbi:hypothetical protein PCIT_b0927 [Pseudoalteromonas citrea]|uniref:Membrane protein insertion efficiency factor YidD n=2 Tax=Pseudoalteromonas citrea TaxID=43655 RepID=A0AAD4AFB5_9GAMM|nr:membrane protein insertion efficiency factor YidD [Pseudoalteromonas citrea]KAF7764842.1 hypothetical protein PCIT_b0927 [Pseudoalteromonas citrea]
MLKHFVLRAIRTYQANGGAKSHFNLSCNFTPSCSEYTYQAIDKYGVCKGGLLGLRRIKRCNDPDCIDVKSDPLP